MAAEQQYSAVNMQHQIRQNSEELQDFLKDLNKWEDEVQAKDKLLSSSKDNISLTHPVRNKVVKKNPKTSVKEEQRRPKIKSYDYRGWDSFDVNQALEEIDNEVNDDENESDSENEEYIEQQRLQQALFEKQKGNDLFKEGKYEAACNRYTTAITLDPYNAIYPANRAMTLIKLKRYGAAIQDCDTALHLDKTYMKAYARRASAKQHLGKLEEALQDYEIMLQLQPENKQAIEEIDKIKKLMFKIPPQTASNIHSKPMKRYVIEEIGCDQSDDEGDNSDEKLTAEVFLNTALNLRKRNQDNETTMKNKTVFNESDNIEKDDKTLSDYVNIDLTMPVSSLQFQKTWQCLEKYPEQRYKYMKMIPPHSLPKVVGESLESSLLLNMFSILKDFYIRDKLCIFNEMKYISELKRFSMTLMFLTDKERLVLHNLFDYLSLQQTKQIFSEQELHKLKERYQHR